MYKRNRWAEAETGLIWRPHASTKKKSNYAQACSVLIHVVMTVTVKSGQAAKETKLFFPPGITHSLTEWAVLYSLSIIEHQWKNVTLPL